jgi:membrane-bound serine protease (ClpP class)
MVGSFVCAAALALAVLTASTRQPEPGARARVIVLSLDGAIQPAALRYVKRGLETAARGEAALVLLELDTPGGLVISLREMTSLIAQSRSPVAVYVTPAGARAASAGFFLLLAADLAAMAPGTNTGAAHPVTLGPGQQKVSQDAIQKMTNDVAALARSLAAKRGRSIEWAEKAVTKSLSYTADEARDKRLIDLVASTRNELLGEIDGDVIRRWDGRQQTLALEDAAVETVSPSISDRLLMVVAKPEVAYLLMLLGLLGIFVEVSHPGAVVPGVVGAVSMLLALYAFSVLPVSLVGALLIVAAVGLFVAEALVISYGALTIAGLACFVLGSMLLIDTPLPGARISLWLVLPATLVMAAATVLILLKAVGARRAPARTGAEALVGEEGEVIVPLEPEGKVLVHGEYWDAIAPDPAPRGTRVSVKAVDRGRRLRVERATPAPAGRG